MNKKTYILDGDRLAKDASKNSGVKSKAKMASLADADPRKVNNWERIKVPESLPAFLKLARLAGNPIEDYIVDKETKAPIFKPEMRMGQKLTVIAPVDMIFTYNKGQHYEAEMHPTVPGVIKVKTNSGTMLPMDYERPTVTDFHKFIRVFEPMHDIRAIIDWDVHEGSFRDSMELELQNDFYCQCDITVHSERKSVPVANDDPGFSDPVSRIYVDNISVEDGEGNQMILSKDEKTILIDNIKDRVKLEN